MAKPMVRKWFHRLKVVHPSVAEEIPTQQEFKDECDINFIVKRWQKGIHPPAWMTSKTPHYGDFSNLPQSFDEAYRVVEEAEAAFNALPLEMRHELDHDPRNLDKAPKELFERFGLLSSKSSSVDSSSLPPAKAGGVDGKEAPVSKAAKQAAKESVDSD